MPTQPQTQTQPQPQSKDNKNDNVWARRKIESAANTVTNTNIKPTRTQPTSRQTKQKINDILALNQTAIPPQQPKDNKPATALSDQKKLKSNEPPKEQIRAPRAPRATRTIPAVEPTVDTTDATTDTTTVPTTVATATNGTSQPSPEQTSPPLQPQQQQTTSNAVSIDALRGKRGARRYVPPQLREITRAGGVVVAPIKNVNPEPQVKTESTTKVATGDKREGFGVKQPPQPQPSTTTTTTNPPKESLSQKSQGRRPIQTPSTAIQPKQSTTNKNVNVKPNNDTQLESKDNSLNLSESRLRVTRSKTNVNTTSTPSKLATSSESTTAVSSSSSSASPSSSLSSSSKYLQLKNKLLTKVPVIEDSTAARDKNKSKDRHIEQWKKNISHKIEIIKPNEAVQWNDNDISWSYEDADNKQDINLMSSNVAGTAAGAATTGVASYDYRPNANTNVNLYEGNIHEPSDHYAQDEGTTYVHHYSQYNQPLHYEHHVANDETNINHNEDTDNDPNNANANNNPNGTSLNYTSLQHSVSQNQLHHSSSPSPH